MATSARRPRVTTVAIIGATTAALVSVTGCADDGAGMVGPVTHADTGSSHGAVAVLAATSLEAAGADLAEAFADEGHAGATVTWTFTDPDARTGLTGAHGHTDLVIGGDQRSAAFTGTAAGPATSSANPRRAVIATDRLVLATAPGNLGSIVGLDQLTSGSTLRIALCAADRPCGRQAHDYLARAGVTLDYPMQQDTVADVVSKVSAGDVDAGFIFSSDARAMQANRKPGTGRVQAFDLPGVTEDRYSAMLTSAGTGNRTAGEFLRWLRTDTARRILADHGFDSAG